MGGRGGRRTERGPWVAVAGARQRIEGADVEESWPAVAVQKYVSASPRGEVASARSTKMRSLSSAALSERVGAAAWSCAGVSTPVVCVTASRSQAESASARPSAKTSARTGYLTRLIASSTILL